MNEDEERNVAAERLLHAASVDTIAVMGNQPHVAERLWIALHRGREERRNTAWVHGSELLPREALLAALTENIGAEAARTMLHSEDDAFGRERNGYLAAFIDDHVSLDDAEHVEGTESARLRAAEAVARVAAEEPARGAAPVVLQRLRRAADEWGPASQAQVARAVANVACDGASVAALVEADFMPVLARWRGAVPCPVLRMAAADPSPAHGARVAGNICIPL